LDKLRSGRESDATPAGVVLAGVAFLFSSKGKKRMPRFSLTVACVAFYLLLVINTIRCHDYKNCTNSILAGKLAVEAILFVYDNID
jgi:hypothetical protein